MVSTNLHNLRVKFGYTQQFIADYLNITAAAVNQYESDARTIPESVIGKLALLYNVEEFDLYEENPEKQLLLTSFAFRAEDVAPDDMQVICKFKKIVFNYIKMSNTIDHG